MGSAAIGVCAAVGIGWAVMQQMPLKSTVSTAPVQVVQTSVPQIAVPVVNEQLTNEQRNMLLEQNNRI